MPRGVPKAGVRLTRKALERAGIAPNAIPEKWEDRQKIPMMAANANTDTDIIAKFANGSFSPITNRPIPTLTVVPANVESDEQIGARLAHRFDMLKKLANAAVKGTTRALIVSGPSGLGKSFTIEQTLDDWDPEGANHTIIKGYVKVTGLYKTLWEYRHAGNVIVFDDADAIFHDDTALNMLKAVCDTTEQRTVSYLAETNMVDSDGKAIDRTFDFNGTIIFITNLDFDAMIEKGSRLSPHLSALVSRSHYLDLTMKTARDYWVRIKQVVAMGMLRNAGHSEEVEADTLAFIEEHMMRMRELSLRMALKVASMRALSATEDHHDWQGIAIATCCRN